MELKVVSAEELAKDVADIKWLSNALKTHYSGKSSIEVYEACIHGPIMLFIIHRYFRGDAVFRSVLVDILLSLTPMLKSDNAITSMHAAIDMIEARTIFTDAECKHLADMYPGLCEEMNDELAINMLYSMMKFMSGDTAFEESFFKKLSLISVIRTLEFVKDFKSNEIDFCNEIRGYVNNIKGG